MKDAASSLDYRPSQAARTLVTGVSDVIVIVLPQLALGPRVEEMMSLVTAAAGEFGKNVLVRFAGSDPLATIAMLADVRPAAVIDLGGLDPALRDRVTEAGIALVPRLDGPLSQFDPNRMIGRLQATELLRGAPRRLIYGMLGDGYVDPNIAARAAGVADVARERGLEKPVEIVIPLEVAAARAALQPLIGDQPVGVACYNDDVAIAVLAAGYSADWSVPEQLAVTGADATPVGQLVRPRLTSVAIDLPRLMPELLRGLRETLTGVLEEASLPALADVVTLVPGETS